MAGRRADAEGRRGGLGGLHCACDAVNGREGGTMAEVSIRLDAELVVEVMVLAGIGSPQDAVEAVVRD